MPWFLMASHPIALWLAFAGSLVFGLTRTGEAARSARVWGTWILAGVLGLIFAASTVLTGYAVVALSGLMLLLAPIAVAAVGLLVGGCLALLRHRGFGWSAAGLALLFLALPVGAAQVAIHKALERRAHREARYADFQQLTVEGTFAGVPVRVPGSPDLETIHRTPSGKYKSVHTRFWQAGGRLQTGRDPAEGQPDFIKLVVMNSLPECDAPQPPVSCLTSSRKRAAWCATRPELLDTPWCDRPRHRLALRVQRNHDRPSLSKWPFAALPPIAIDAHGEPVWLRCGKKARPTQACRAEFALTDDVLAEISLFYLEADARLDEAREMHAYAERLWRTMSGRD